MRYIIDCKTGKVTPITPTMSAGCDLKKESRLHYFMMHLPLWLEKIASRSEKYRGWYIKEVCKVLRKEAIQSFVDDGVL